MQKFLVLYRTPTSVIDDWMKTPEAERKSAEEKMQKEWEEWERQHASQVTETAGAGKTKRVAEDGITDTRNDVMLYSIVEAASPEEAAKMFADHPHLTIPQSTIDVMASNPVPKS